MEITRKSCCFLILATIAASIVFGAVPAEAGNAQESLPAWVEPDVDRPGSDFRILWLHGGLEACQEACAQNPLCKSYTYVKEGSPGRIGGCWLKDAVSAPVRDACCVSGVKTGETVSRYLQELVTVPKEVPAAPPQTQTDVPGSMDREPEPVEEKEPETGSGERRRAALDFSATPPGQVAGKTGNGRNHAIASPPADVGTGRRRTEALNFAAVPPGTTAVPVAEPAPPRGHRDTGAGRRGIRGVIYAVAPPSGEVSFPDGPRARSVVREINGVDITAVPPER